MNNQAISNGNVPIHVLNENGLFTVSETVCPNPGLSGLNLCCDLLEKGFKISHLSDEIHVHILLDDRHAVIGMCITGRGNPDSVSESAGYASYSKSLNASYVVLCHNHPSGAAFPSLQDLMSTMANRLALSETLYDSIIVGNSKTKERFSFLQNDLLVSASIENILKHSIDKKTKDLYQRLEKQYLKQKTKPDSYFFGRYEQPQEKPIEWLVVRREGNRLFLVSKYALAIMPVHNLEGSISYKDSSIRKWLNEDFIQKSFNEKEKNQIDFTSIESEGFMLDDKVFLLDTNEVMYLFKNYLARRCTPTDEAYERDLVSSRYKKNGKATCLWWLRDKVKTDSEATDRFQYVGFDGDINERGTRGSYKWHAYCRPALWITIPE